MDSNQQYPSSPQGNPYEFILNPQKTPRQGKFGLGGHNFILTLVMIIGGALLFMIILTVLINAFTPKKVGTVELTGLAQTQTELMRISEQAAGDARRQATKNLATTVQYTLMTQRKQTLKVIGNGGTEVSDKELALKQNADTDQRFATAKATSTFDKTFTEIIEKELNSYAATLKQLTTENSSKSERERMSDYYRQTQQLISQIPYTQDSIESADTAEQQ